MPPGERTRRIEQVGEPGCRKMKGQRMAMRGKWLTAARRAGVMRCDAYFAVILHWE
jgi:hypothetical protein